MEENIKSFEELAEENRALKEKNEKLYKDCVSFAKKIKASEDSASKIEELEAEVASLKAEISRLASSDRISEYFGADDDYSEPEEKPFSLEIIEDKKEDTYEDIYADQPSSLDEIAAPVAAYEPPVFDDLAADSIPKNHTTYKKSPIRTFVRTFLWIFLVLSMLIGIVSFVAYLFSTCYQDYGIANYRFASVYNNALSPSITKDHIILIKYSNFDGIEIGSPVITTKDERSIALLKSLDVIDGENIATVEDKNGAYTVNEDQFIGQVKLSIPYLGIVVQYACSNEYNYLAFVVAANLLFLGLLLIVPSNKAKTPKFGKDYTVEDFTI